MGIFNTSAPCPYCYTVIDTRELAFRCGGATRAGNPPCVPAVDVVRRQRFGDSHSYLPAFAAKKGVRTSGRAECPACHGATSIRLCPECHSRLPAGFGSDSPLFGLLGVRSSGKTVMLAVLLEELTKGETARRFNYSVTVPGGNEEGTETQRLRRILRRMEGGSGSDGELPEQTQRSSGERAKPVVFEWKRERQGLKRLATGEDYKATVFSFYDTAGEDLDTLDRAETQRYIKATSGIILLLDPFSFPCNRSRVAGVKIDATDPRDVLGNITEVLRQGEGTKPGRKIKQPVAVAISKIDAFFDSVHPNDPIRRPSLNLPVFDEAESLDTHEHLKALVAEWGGADLIRDLETDYANARFFGISALGFQPDYAVARVNPHGISPHRVAEPLLWLMANRGVVERRG